MSLNFTVPFSQADAERLRNLSALEPLRRQFGWVLWRWTQNSKGKWDKPPFQIAKPTENAANNRPLTWGKFEDALSVALRERMSGIGFCLHLNFACFDLDDCRDRETGAIAPWARELIEACSRSITLGTNPWTGATIIEREGCYCEITPSLTGLRIWGYGRPEKVAHKEILMPDSGKLETFRGTHRYLTVTGRVFENYDGALKNLDPIIDAYQQAETERQGPRPPRYERRAQGAGPVDVNQLRDGLSFIPADDREVWLHVGMACHTIGARDIWDDWSQTSDKYDEAGQDKAWDSFDPDGAITIGTVFALAKQNGWRPTLDIGPDCGMCVETIDTSSGPDLSFREAESQGEAENEPAPSREPEDDGEGLVGPGQTPPEPPRSPPGAKNGSEPLPEEIAYRNFYAYADMGNYFFLPQGSTWPAKSVNARLPWIPILDATGQPARYTRGEKAGQVKLVAPNVWLDSHQVVESLTWAPGFPQIVKNARFSDGGWVEAQGCTVLNLYRPPTINILHANVQRVGLYLEHWHWLYPEDANHILTWQACRMQHPEIKINHCLLLGGAPGIGKDSALEPLRQAVGPWNFQEVSPADVLGGWTYFRRSVICRVSEAHDLGESDRFQLYERLKTLCAAPPDTLSVNEKHLRQYAILNLVGVIITTNYRTDAIYLPPDDRRTYVAWSEIPADSLPQERAAALWHYYKIGGFEDIAAYLRQYDLSQFDAYAAPKKTEAFWSIVGAHRPKEESALMDILDLLGNPDAVTLEHVQTAAGENNKLAEWLGDSKNSRAIPHRFENCGYVACRNSNARDGLWRILGKRQVVYVKKDLDNNAREAAIDVLRNETTGIVQARMRDAAARHEAEQAAMNLERAMKAEAKKGNVVRLSGANPFSFLVANEKAQTKRAPDAEPREIGFDTDLKFQE